MPAAVDDVLDVLRDGKWHTIEDIDTQCRDLNRNQIEFILSFLAEYGFVKRLRQPGTLTHTLKAQLTFQMQSFLQRLEELKT